MPAAQMKLLPYARLQGNSATAVASLPGAPSPGRQGAVPHKIAKARHTVPGLGDATANQEVVKPVDLGPVCSGCKHAFTVPVHSIASSGTKVKRKSKKAAHSAAFLYDFARKAAQYVCRLPMDKAYNAMYQTTQPLYHCAARLSIQNTKKAAPS